MLAVQSLGGIPIPLYQDAVAAECVFPINNADVRFAFAEDQEQVDKLLEIRAQCPQLSNIYFDDPRGLRNYAEPGLLALDGLIEAGQAFAAKQPDFFRAQIELAQPGDVAAMFFTSCIPTTACWTAPAPGPTLTSSPPARKCWPICRRPGSGRTFSATRSGWPAVTW
jgi:acyl-CoA synthetase (AMP-forming)/AMP-acid ligase II